MPNQAYKKRKSDLAEWLIIGGLAVIYYGGAVGVSNYLADKVEEYVNSPKAVQRAKPVLKEHETVILYERGK